MTKKMYFLVILTSMTFSGCSTILENLPGVYSLDIQQGNVINQEMIDQLRPKMTKRQVLYIMGSSMLVDVFHPKRWDYLYSEQLDGEPRQQKRLSIYFEGDELVSVQGDFRPSSKPVPRKNKSTTVEVPPRIFDKTMWEKITGLFDDDPETQIQKPDQDQLEKNQTEIPNLSAKIADQTATAAEKTTTEKSDP